ncbi:hypothetical protein [uncultured Metabacillus sp.]|uniref:hypothetical protein n=1 Tax=uncultured Metabacillus sp. TaxID=2860135 RepID=UPI002607875A|nr:hypothetical protein [uncultured Metabacillus sp.]
MKVSKAMSIATEWVLQNASKEKWFMGAYFSGSTVGMPEDAEMSPYSDVDVVVVTSKEEVPLKLGKFVYKNVLLEVTYLSWDLFGTVEEVLTSYHLAGSFRVNTIIADPTGHFQKLYTEVSKQFAKREWVTKRCENARSKVENGIRGFDHSAPFHDQVTSWVFPTGITTHVILVAALQNPTVRLRYLAARKVLMEYGFADVYTELMELLGCADLTPQQVEGHLDQLAQTFDLAAAVSKTPFFFSTDITSAARPVVIDGSRHLIRTGYHRETVFWIVATFARCHKILAADAPQSLQRERTPAFEALLADIGITTTSDLIRRGNDVIQFLPKLWKTTEKMIDANTSVF